MAPAALKLRRTYARIPGAPLVQREFGFYCLDEWKAQGMPGDVPLDVLFGYDEWGKVHLGGLGWCEAPFVPAFDVEVLRSDGDYEVVRDVAGRHVLYFKGRRDGFMPTYLEHPVRDLASFGRDVAWRLDPKSPERQAEIERSVAAAEPRAAQGYMITQNVIGGYMYLRSLLGPEELLTAFYEMPEVIHRCMQAWFELADSVIARHQARLTLDEIFFAEDICFKTGALISPAMMREFLLPYYRELITRVRARQLDAGRHLFVQIDTDGRASNVIDVYREIGMDAMSPFEVAAGQDVVEIGKAQPDLIMLGGLDKRELSRGRAAIDRMLERILPAMRARGGYIPTCDHGVPAEVPYADYLYFRERSLELGN